MRRIDAVPRFKIWITSSLGVILALALASTASAKNRPDPVPTLRWAEGQPGCTFDRSDDGKYRYGLWSGDFGVILSVDSQELEKVRRRILPLVGAQLTVRYRGSDSSDFAARTIVLEFVKHNHDIHGFLDPSDLSKVLQDELDAVAEKTNREIRRHPQKKEELEKILQARQKDVSEMQEFLSAHSLHPAKLDPGNPETTGWAFFSAQSEWGRSLKKQEDFVLRVSLQKLTVEFPFSLPPNESDFTLRHRPEKQ
jgi:hypothetical protein